jgi:hypothetical protein
MLMTPWRQAGLLEQPHGEVRCELLRRRRLPDDDVAHQRRREREVAGDGGEVERRDGVDEALERPVVHGVPHTRRALRLLLDDEPAVGDVEPQEVDQLARRVDLGLLHGLRLTEHGRRVERVAPRPGEQVGRLEQHRRACVVRHGGPLGRGLERRIDGRLRVLLGGVAHRPEDVRAAVRLDRVDRLAAADPLLAADRHRQLDRVGRRELLEARLEGGALLGSGRIGPDRLVDRDGYGGDAVHCVPPWGSASSARCPMVSRPRSRRGAHRAWSRTRGSWSCWHDLMIISCSVDHGIVPA